MNPKISVIIPVYNAEKYIKECLDSVLCQTLKEIEVIVVNDGSSDNSKQIIENYQNKDNRLFLINKRNEGAGPSRNKGIKESKGEFIAFMDADDYYPSNDILESLYFTAQEHGVKIVGGKRVRLMEDMSLSYDSDTIEYFGQVFFAQGITQYKDFQYDYGYTQYIYERQLLINNDIFFPVYRRFQDPPFFVKAMIAAETFYYLNTYVYCFRRVFGAKDAHRKWSIDNVIDMLEGLIENLSVSRDKNLAKLHFLTTNRLNTEGSFLAIQNLYSNKNEALLAKLIEANQAVDVKWLKESGYEISEPFVLDVFKYAVITAEKYESLRNRRIIKAIRKIIGK